MADDREITDAWITKDQLALKLGKSVAAVTRLQTAGRLHPKRDETGVNRYSPDEVADVLSDPADTRAMARRNEYAEFELGTVREVLDLVKLPREKIDTLLFDIIKELRAEIAELKREKKENALLVEQAKDNQAEREVATQMLQQEQGVKMMAAQRFIEVVSSLLTSGKEHGVKFTPEQLEQLLIADAEAGPGASFLTAEQSKMAKTAIIAYKEELKRKAEKSKNETSVATLGETK